MARSLFFALFLLGIIWGGAYFFIKVLLHDFGPWTIAFFRSSLGLAVIVLIMLVMRKPFEFRKISWVIMSVMALASTAIPWAIIGFSETRLSSSMASVLIATTPLWTMILGKMFFGAGINRMQWLSMGIAIVGLLVLLDFNSVSIISMDLFGFIGMIIAALCYAIGSQLSKRLLKELSMYQITFGTLLCATLGSGSAALLTERISLSSLASGSNIAALIGLGIFGSGIAYILFYYLVQAGGPVIATTVTYLLPVSAMIWGSTILREEIHWNLLAGLALILGGVFLASGNYSKRAITGSKTRGKIRTFPKRSSH